MQLTMEPLEEMLASARVMDEAGMDAIWLAEAYPWWRKHGMEARSSTVASALIARETQRLTIGWGIIAASTRPPVQAAMDARVVQEAAGPGRFILGFGASKIFLKKPKMQQLDGEIADGCLTPSITTPGFVRYTRDNVGGEIDVGCTVVASIHETDRDAGRDGAREIAGMYLANKVQNIQGAADTLLDLAGLEQDEIRPIAEAMERGGRLAAKELVTDEILDKCKPIAGTPDDCIRAIEEYREAGCTHVMLELWGKRRREQIELFGSEVLPHVR